MNGMVPLLGSAWWAPILQTEERVKTGLLAVLFLIAAVGARAGNLETLKTTATLYVVAMKSALVRSETSSCAEIVAVANEYAKAKIAYYDAARAAMPKLLQSARGEGFGSAEEKELIEIFRGFGEDRDEEAAAALQNKLRACPASDESAKALSAIDGARKIAEQFVKDFGQMEGV
jgi:hypothetical protein